MTREQAIECMARALSGKGPNGVCRVAREIAITAYDALTASGMAIVPVEPPFNVKLAGAGAITEDHMRKMANYDAAIDCWRAMITAAQEANNA